MAIFKKDDETAETPEAGGEAPRYLTRDQILAVKDISEEDVFVPEWGGTVRVRGMTGTERSQLEASIAKNPKRMNLLDYQAKVVVACLVDSEGNQLFASRDVALLGRKSAASLNRLYEVAQRLSGLTDEDADDLLGE